MEITLNRCENNIRYVKDWHNRIVGIIEEYRDNEDGLYYVYRVTSGNDTLQSINNLFEIVLYDGKLEIL